MYHQVMPRTEPAFEPYLCLTPEALRGQVRQLQAHGLQLLTMAQAAGYISSGHVPGMLRCAALTFDDAGGNFMQYALPVLQELGVSATIYVVASALDGETAANLPESTRLICREDVPDVVKAGIEIGSHTLTHRELTSLPDRELANELQQSRRIIEDAAGKACTSVCYPRGRFSPRVEMAVGMAGYTSACTTLRGNLHAQQEIYALKRIRVHESRKGLKLWYTTTRIFDWLNRKRCQRERMIFADRDVGLTLNSTVDGG